MPSRAPEGRHDVAWGVSPRSTDRESVASGPGGATSRHPRCRPSGARDVAHDPRIIRWNASPPTGDLAVPIEVTMAKLSPTMESGQLVKWLVKVGDKVKEGDTLAEVQTDKAVMPMESFDEGTVARLDVQEG